MAALNYDVKFSGHDGKQRGDVIQVMQNAQMTDLIFDSSFEDGETYLFETGDIVTAMFISVTTGEPYTSGGTLTPTNGTNQFTWVRSAGDVGLPDNYKLSFKVVHVGGDVDYSTLVDYIIVGVPDGVDNLPSPLVGVTVAEAAWLALALATVPDAADLVSSADLALKADKIIPATVGNLAGLDATGNLTDSGMAPTLGLTNLSNVLYVDPSFTSATVGWGVYAFDTLGTAIAAAFSGDTIYVNGITTEAGALVIPVGVHVCVMQNSRVTTDGGTTLAAVTLADNTASFVTAGQLSAGNLSSGVASGVGNGGDGNIASGTTAGVGNGGNGNLASGDGAGVGNGGDGNTASGTAAGVGNGGNGNTASGDDAGVGNGGDGNIASGTAAGVGNGGNGNTASGVYSGVGNGGISNTASGDYSGVGNGGISNTASGDYSGVVDGSRRAKATHQGAKLSSDSQNFDFPSAAIDEFAVRAVGGVRLVTAIDGVGAPTATHKLTDVLNSLPYVALASLPLASTVPGAIAATSDGGTGSTPALMYSNGTVWEALVDSADVVPKNAEILSKSALYTLAADDAAKIIECDGTFTLTAPDGLPAGFQVAIANVGTGVITVAATTTLQSKSAAVTLANQYGMATLYHRGSNVWLLAGDLS